MKQLLLFVIAFGVIGLSKSDAQDSLQTKYILLKKMKEYSTPSSRVEGNAADQQKTRRSAKENNHLKYYDVHTATTDNKLKISVANNFDHSFEEITIQITDIPNWVNIDRKQKTISLSANTQTQLTFSFDVASNVSVGQKDTFTLETTEDSNYYWSKEIAIKVTSPGKFKLMPNYPNPFNPSTTIQYNLPARMEVTVSIYDVLGRRVAILADKIQEAGQYKLRWNASNMASGLYFYQIIADGQKGRKVVKQKKMMLIK